MSFLLRTGAVLLLTAPCSLAQPQPASPQPDVLLFVDGERLIGRFLRSNGNSLTFHSDVAGDITVDWAKVQELHTSQRFAVIEKNVRLRRNESDGAIPQGVLEMT